MLESEKSKYFKKLDNLFIEGLKNGSITPFDENLYEKMGHTYVSGIPVSIYIKYLNPTLLYSDHGKCLDESLCMFFCFPNALLVRGNLKDLELRGKCPYHGWVEMDEYVYDPSRLLKFKKDIFYQLYEPSDISTCDIHQYINISPENGEFYDSVQNATLEDFLPNGGKRHEIYLLAPLLSAIAEMSNNKDFQKDVCDFFDSISYNERQVKRDMTVVFQKQKEFF